MISSQNIGFDCRDDIKLFDFGLAKELRDSQMTEDGLYRLTAETGSPRYMAPGTKYCECGCHPLLWDSIRKGLNILLITFFSPCIDIFGNEIVQRLHWETHTMELATRTPSVSFSGKCWLWRHPLKCTL